MLTKKETKFYNAIMARLDEVQYIPLDDLPHCLEGLSHKVKTRFSPDGSVKEFIESFPSIFHISNNNNIWLTKTWLTEGIKHLLLNRGDASTSGATSPRLDSSAAGTISASSSSSHNDEDNEKMTRKEIKLYNALLKKFEEVQHIPLHSLPNCLHPLSHKVKAVFSEEGRVGEFLRRFPSVFYISRYDNVLLTASVVNPFQNSTGSSSAGTSSGDDQQIKSFLDSNEEFFHGALLQALKKAEFIRLLDLPHTLTSLSHHTKLQFQSIIKVTEFLQRHEDIFHLSQCNNVLLKEHVLLPAPVNNAGYKFGRDIMISVPNSSILIGECDDDEDYTSSSDDEDYTDSNDDDENYDEDEDYADSNEDDENYDEDENYIDSNGDDNDYSESSDESSEVFLGLTGKFIHAGGYIEHGNDIAFLSESDRLYLSDLMGTFDSVHFDALFLRERANLPGGRILSATNVWVGRKV